MAFINWLSALVFALAFMISADSTRTSSSYASSTSTLLPGTSIPSALSGNLSSLALGLQTASAPPEVSQLTSALASALATPLPSTVLAPPTGLNVDSVDPSSVHMTWDTIPGAAGYAIWIRNCSEPDSVPTPCNVTTIPCWDFCFPEPGVWNLEFCVSALEGCETSSRSPCVAAPFVAIPQYPRPTCTTPLVNCTKSPVSPGGASSIGGASSSTRSTISTGSARRSGPGSLEGSASSTSTTSATGAASSANTGLPTSTRFSNGASLSTATGSSTGTTSSTVILSSTATGSSEGSASSATAESFSSPASSLFPRPSNGTGSSISSASTIESTASVSIGGASSTNASSSINSASSSGNISSIGSFSSTTALPSPETTSSTDNASRTSGNPSLSKTSTASSLTIGITASNGNTSSAGSISHISTLSDTRTGNASPVATSSVFLSTGVTTSALSGSAVSGTTAASLSTQHTSGIFTNSSSTISSTGSTGVTVSTSPALSTSILSSVGNHTLRSSAAGSAQASRSKTGMTGITSTHETSSVLGTGSRSGLGNTSSLISQTSRSYSNSSLAGAGLTSRLTSLPGLLITTTLFGGLVVTTDVPATSSPITTTLSGGSVLTTTALVPIGETPVTTTLSDGSFATVLVPGTGASIQTLTTLTTVVTESSTSTLPDGSHTLVFNSFPTTETVSGLLVPVTSHGSTFFVESPIGPLPTSSSQIHTLPPFHTLSGSITSTMTTLPPGISIEDFTEFPITANIWWTTTDSQSSTTIVPVIKPCSTCQPIIIWKLPELPWVKFIWPSIPELPSFHLPCIKIFGIVIAGDCPKKSGPPPVTDEPPAKPEPEEEPADDPCDFRTEVGLCPNGNYPVFDPSSGTINCDVPSDQVDSQIGQCQRNIDDNIDSVLQYLENERTCCPPSSKAKRQSSPGMSFVFQRSLASAGLGLMKRADYCPNLNQDPRRPPRGSCYATYTCPHALFPNVCGNAKSAIFDRGKTSILTHVSGTSKGKALHDTEPWYDGHFVRDRSRPFGGWKLSQCQVEEYPFGSGNPDRNADGTAVLRLIPGGNFGQDFENQNAGIHLRRWILSVSARYNGIEDNDHQIGPNGIVYCVAFDPSFTKYRPEDLINENFCAQPYGPEFTLVNGQLDDQGGEETLLWDPWFDVPGTNRKSRQLLHYIDLNGNIVEGRPTKKDKAVYGLVPPLYCNNPSPGRQDYDRSTGKWSLRRGYQRLGRITDNVLWDRCTDPPPNINHFTRASNVSDSHSENLAKRQISSGSFLDERVYVWLGCSGNGDDTDGDGFDPCAADDSPCEAYAVPTFGGNETMDPIPASTEPGLSTDPVTLSANHTASVSTPLITNSSSLPATTTSTSFVPTSFNLTTNTSSPNIPSFTPTSFTPTTNASSPSPTSIPTPSFIPCSTHYQDPDSGMTQAYCVCAGSTFAMSTDTAVIPANICAYTSPLPTATLSISTPASTTAVSALTTASSSSIAASASPSSLLLIFNRFLANLEETEAFETWTWEGVESNLEAFPGANWCDHSANPVLASSPEGNPHPTASFPSSLGPFNIATYTSCSYEGPNTATVGSVTCDGGPVVGCTAVPSDTAIQFFNCSSNDALGDSTGDWWFWKITCGLF